MQKTKKQIFSLVKKYHKLSATSSGFIPGKTRINFSGRVWNHKELVNLVDSSLEFWLTAGKYAAKFEREFSGYLGVKYSLLTNSGSSANLLAITALTSPLLGKKKLQPGDEVITTAAGFPTTLNPIIQNNLVPVFVDIDLNTLNIDVKKMESAVSKKTKAIFLAHTLGNPADLTRITGFAKKNKLFFLEDCCDALGSTYKGRKVGSFGNISTFSFYPAHHMTMGEGGCLATSDPLLKKIITSFRDWGRDCICETGKDNACGRRFGQQHGQLPFGYDHKYVYSHIGYNLKITDLQAAIGCAQLKKLPRFVSLRQRNFNYLKNYFKKHERFFRTAESEIASQPAWFGFPLIVKKNAKFTRDVLVAYLEKHQIATRMLFAGNLAKQPAYKNSSYRISGNLKNTDIIMNDLLWIGVYPGITAKMLRYITEVFDSFLCQKN